MSVGSLTVYCIDTSILIELHLRYPREIFSGVWDALEALIAADRAIAPKQVREELSAKDDWLWRWAQSQKQMFKPQTKAHAMCASEITARFPSLAHAERPGVVADPFVIALALAEKKASLVGSDCAVVTCEARRKGKIPDACDYFGIRCLSLFDFMKEAGWKFVAERAPAPPSS
ncbi:MAG: DUF4411 family protein [Planctomycetes bacterium]|nr:DUF4411 family protein [Planctomycetota bacterium]